eukprot:TRINITY_DN14288_c0_g1_i1.p1 TRINITY_DN14288_c0_g1~~TRINITY_DN14288_c0_g1_i1.p1  ORF type:complete len:213 (-),score=39.78 TRINITY_DN14288_c0_g1_i1:33-671(-)
MNPGCQKAYGSEGALKHHFRTKHPEQQYQRPHGQLKKTHLTRARSSEYSQNSLDKSSDYRQQSPQSPLGKKRSVSRNDDNENPRKREKTSHSYEIQDTSYPSTPFNQVSPHTFNLMSPSTLLSDFTSEVAQSPSLISLRMQTPVASPAPFHKDKTPSPSTEIPPSPSTRQTKLPSTPMTPIPIRKNLDPGAEIYKDFNHQGLPWQYSTPQKD